MPHLCPQVPQLDSSVLRLVQAPLQQVAVSPEQICPHEPQLPLLVVRFTPGPLQVVPPLMKHAFDTRIPPRVQRGPDGGSGCGSDGRCHCCCRCYRGGGGFSRSIRTGRCTADHPGRAHDCRRYRSWRHWTQVHSSTRPGRGSYPAGQPFPVNRVFVRQRNALVILHGIPFLAVALALLAERIGRAGIPAPAAVGGIADWYQQCRYRGPASRQRRAGSCLQQPESWAPVLPRRLVSRLSAAGHRRWSERYNRQSAS